MAAIPRTLLATSDPITLTKGFSLFPTILPTPLPLGVQYAGTFFSYDRYILGQGCNLSAGYSLFFGVAGPSFAIRQDVEGSTEARRVTLKVTVEQMAAGLVFGASAGLNLTAGARIAWKRLNFSLNLNFDLISFCFTILQTALGTGHVLTRVGDKLPSLQASYGMLDTTDDAFAKNNGVITATPSLDVPINLWSLLVLADTSTLVFGGTVTAANAALSATLSYVVVGPTIGLGLRVQIRLSAILLDDTVVPVTRFDAGASTVTAESASDLPAAPTRVGFRYAESPSFDLRLGVTAQLTLLQIFSFGASFSFSVRDALGYSRVPPLGTWNHDLRNTIGRQTVVLHEVEFA